jgi:glycosyltransferase involved in cell wall biosynthesis
VTRSPIVHQFTAVLAERDALGRHTLAVDDLLREMGAQTQIYATHVHAEVRDRGRDFREHPDDPAPDLIIYQASTGTPVADYVASRSEPTVLSYHNMTPAIFFDMWEPAVAAELDHGRRQLARLCRKASSGIAVSEYNAAELRDLGLDHVDVAPVLFNPLGSDGDAPDAFDGATLLFVGRVSPNKCQQDLVGVLVALHDRGIAARLVLVGGASSTGYHDAVVELAARMGVADSVVFAGSVSESELVGWYGAADVFVSASEHEGFCVPVVEAMSLGVPVVAFGSSAIPETVRDAGLVLADKSAAVMVEAIDRVLTDATVRDAMIERGRARAAALGPPASVRRMRDVLQPLLVGAGS